MKVVLIENTRMFRDLYLKEKLRAVYDILTY